MLLTHEQKLEKAVQHLIVFARFVAHDHVGDVKQTGEVLRLALERVQNFGKFTNTPDGDDKAIDTHTKHPHNAT